MDNREIYVSTTGYAMKVLTDARVEKVLDAAYDSVADGNYAEGALGAIDSIENYLEMGVPAGQYTQVREEKNIPWNGMRCCLRRLRQRSWRHSRAFR